MHKKLITITATILFFLLFIGDSIHSYYQHSLMRLDGDLVTCVLPRDAEKPILESPLGLNAIFKGERYDATNRFFAHYFFKEYYENMCQFLRKLTDPIDAIYWASSIAKLFFQILLILIIAVFVSGNFKLFSVKFWGAVCLIFPLFQTFGSNRTIGIIDQSNAYAFFYAMFHLFLLIYFLPLFLRYFWNNKQWKYHYVIKIIWIPLAFMVTLGGPLEPGIALIVTLLIFAFYFAKEFQNAHATAFFKRLVIAIKKIPFDYWYYGLIISILSLYSLYLGGLATQYSDSPVSLWNRFLLVPIGVAQLFSQDLALPLIMFVIILNYFLLRFSCAKKLISKEKLNKIYLWVFLFAIIYFLLLPFGGYRTYREFIVRYDTFSPITILLVFLFAYTSFMVIKGLRLKYNIPYLTVILAILTTFSIRDISTTWSVNGGEKKWLYIIRDSENEKIEVNEEVTILAWELFEYPEYSELQSQFMQKFKITETPKYYYHKIE